MRPDALCGVLALPKHVFNAGFLAPHVLNILFMVLVTAEAKQAPERLWKKTENTLTALCRRDLTWPLWICSIFSAPVREYLRANFNHQQTRKAKKECNGPPPHSCLDVIPFVILQDIRHLAHCAISMPKCMHRCTFRVL
jgi:hypothetical protein